DQPAPPPPHPRPDLPGRAGAPVRGALAKTPGERSPPASERAAAFPLGLGGEWPPALAAPATLAAFAPQPTAITPPSAAYALPLPATPPPSAYAPQTPLVAYTPPVAYTPLVAYTPPVGYAPSPVLRKQVRGRGLTAAVIGA